VVARDRAGAVGAAGQQRGLDRAVLAVVPHVQLVDGLLAAGPDRRA
jgi:hypothetical protein